MIQSKKDLKRIKRAFKQGARVQYMGDMSYGYITIDSPTRCFELTYRIHPEDEANFDKKGRKYLKPEELVVGEWYDCKTGLNNWCLKFTHYDNNSVWGDIWITLNDSFVTDHSRISFNEAKFTKTSKKKLKKIKKLLDDRVKVSIDNINEGVQELEKEKSIIRHATKEELRSLYTIHPELIPDDFTVW